MSTSPQVSVLLPSYNYARYLQQTIDSVLTQTFQDFELLILDDGSRDDSFDIAQQAAARDPRVVAWRQPNQGVVATLNTLFERSRGRLIAQLGSDDVWLPRRLQVGVEHLARTPKDVAVFCSYFIIDAHNAGIPQMSQFSLGRKAGPDLFEQIIEQNCLCACTALLRREALADDEPYSKNLTLVQDWDLWLRLGSKGPMTLLTEVGALYRWHDTNLTQKEPLLGIKEHRIVYESVCLPLSKGRRDGDLELSVVARLAHYCWEDGDRKAASFYLERLREQRSLSPNQELQRLIGLFSDLSPAALQQQIADVEKSSHDWPSEQRRMLEKLCASVKN